MEIKIPNKLNQIVQHLSTIDGVTSYLAGGCVRDALLGIPNHDYDVEVYGIPYDQLREELTKFGRVDLVGKAFGVLKLHDADDFYDFSLPRTDSKVSDATATKGRGFVATVDHTLTPEEACARRDFTINAMLYNPITKELVDPFNGQKDIKDKILRATSDKFSEDPLRALRGFQFVARFDLHTTSNTFEVLKSISQAPLVPERVGEEWLKFFKKGTHLCEGLEYLRLSGWLENYPEINNLIDVHQNPMYHPEGDVYTHTKIVLQNVCDIVAKDTTIDESTRAVLLVAALAHDFGKVSTTSQNEQFKWVSPGHAASSVTLAQEFMTRIGLPFTETNKTKVLKLVEHHMDFVNWKNMDKIRVVRTLADALYPATIKELHVLMVADRMVPSEDERVIEKVMVCARAQNAYDKPLDNILCGTDILRRYPSMPKDKRMGEALTVAHARYVEGKIHTKEEALHTAMAQLRKTCCVIQGVDIMKHCGIPEGEKVGYYINMIWELQLQSQSTWLSREDALKLISSCEAMMVDARLELISDCSGISLKRYKFRRWLNSVIPAIVLTLLGIIVLSSTAWILLWHEHTALKQEVAEVSTENNEKWQKFEQLTANIANGTEEAPK